MNLSTQRSLIEAIENHALKTPEKPAVIFTRNGVDPLSTISFKQVADRAKAAANQLINEGLTGKRALLLYPHGPDFIYAFLGCLYAGVVAVPAYPPRPGRKPTVTKNIINNCTPSVILTNNKTAENIGSALHGELSPPPPIHILDGESVASIEINSLESDIHTPSINGETLAFLQYTSGSTGSPKGVMVRHRNLMANFKMICEPVGLDHNCLMASWLPLYHDMGLIGHLLIPLYTGGGVVLLSPFHFIQQPVRWLRAISHFRVHSGGGPNSGYSNCVERVTEQQKEGLDLSCWKIAYNGAEPIHAQTMEKFSEIFKPYGFEHESFYPCYGMAEATLYISGPSDNRTPFTQAFSDSKLKQGDITPVEAHDHDAHLLVGSGNTPPGMEVCIAQIESNQLCRNNHVGELCLRSEAVAENYWGYEKNSKNPFTCQFPDKPGGDWYRTGDLGFIYNNEIFVTGRLKDLIIIEGRNHYPQDIEASVVEYCKPHFKTSGVVAFPVTKGSSESLVIIAEIDKKTEEDSALCDQILNKIRLIISEQHMISVGTAVLTPVGSILKTSSGKLRRKDNCKILLDGEVNIIRYIGNDISNWQS